MLLNEFIKEHRRNEQQEAKLSGQEKEIVRLEATVKELMTTVEKVSARLEAQERGGRLVGNR
jgi:archaellum component FlaC